jgi:hypothetical protein
MELLQFVGKIILIRLLRLLVCISVEAWVLKRGLAISPRTSVEYAAAINLLANCVSWLIFFTLEPIVPKFLKQQLLLNLAFGVDDISLIVLGLSVLNFLLFLVVKWQGLELVRVLTHSGTVKQAAPLQQGYQFRIIVKAHTMSHVAILIIFLINKLSIN